MQEKVTLVEAARMLGISYSGIYALITRGKLPQPTYELREYVAKRKTAVLPRELVESIKK